MALGHRRIDRLADDRAGVVDHRGHVGELVELMQVVERAVAPLVVEVIDERRSVSRCKRDVIATDHRAPLGIACVHGEAARILGDQRHQQLARDAHAKALHLGAGVLPHRGRLGVAKVDPHLLEDRERGFVDHLQARLVQDLVDRHAPLEHRQRADLHRGPRLTPGLAPATSSLTRCRRHDLASLLLSGRLHGPSNPPEADSIAAFTAVAPCSGRPRGAKSRHRARPAA